MAYPLSPIREPLVKGLIFPDSPPPPPPPPRPGQFALAPPVKPAAVSPGTEPATPPSPSRDPPNFFPGTTPSFAISQSQPTQPSDQTQGCTQPPAPSQGLPQPAGLSQNLTWAWGTPQGDQLNAPQVGPGKLLPAPVPAAMAFHAPIQGTIGNSSIAGKGNVVQTGYPPYAVVQPSFNGPAQVLVVPGAPAAVGSGGGPAPPGTQVVVAPVMNAVPAGLVANPQGVVRSTSAPRGAQNDVLNTMQTIQTVQAELSNELTRSRLALARPYGGALPGSTSAPGFSDQIGASTALAALESDQQLFQRIENLQAKNQFLRRHQEMLLSSARTEHVWSAKMQDLRMHEDRLARLEEELRDREDRVGAATVKQREETQSALQQQVIQPLVDFQNTIQEQIHQLSEERARMDRDMRNRINELEEARIEQQRHHMERMQELEVEAQKVRGTRSDELKQQLNQSETGAMDNIQRRHIKALQVHEVGPQIASKLQQFEQEAQGSQGSWGVSANYGDAISDASHGARYTSPRRAPRLGSPGNGISGIANGTGQQPTPFSPSSSSRWGPIPWVYQAALDVVETHGWSALHGDTPAWTALHWAAAEGRVDICKYLMSKGADSRLLDELGLTAIEYAQDKGNIDCVEVLLSDSGPAEEIDAIEDPRLPKSLNGVRVSQAALPDWSSAKASAALKAAPVVYGQPLPNADMRPFNSAGGIGDLSVLPEESQYPSSDVVAQSSVRSQRLHSIERQRPRGKTFG